MREKEERERRVKNKGIKNEVISDYVEISGSIKERRFVYNNFNMWVTREGRELETEREVAL